MGKIKGKFAPLTEELGNDERFIIECTDFEKLIYMLIIYTTHMTRHQAPIDPQYYRHRYGIKARSHQIRHAIDTLLKRFPGLKLSNEKLSLIKSATYESQIVQKESLELEREKEVEEELEREKEARASEPDKPEPINQPPEETLEADSEFDLVDAFHEVWEIYPQKGRVRPNQAMQAFCAIVVNAELLERVKMALKKYIAYLKSVGWEMQPMNFSNWFAEWPEWEKHEEPAAKPREKRPKKDCSVCAGTGYLPDQPGYKCWCWDYPTEAKAKVSVSKPEIHEESST